MNVPHATSKPFSKDLSTPKADLSEEQIIASLYKDVNNNADNEGWSPSHQKSSIYAQKVAGSKSMTLSSSPKKPKQNLNKQKTLPPPFSPSIKIVTTAYDFGDADDQENDVNDNMKSPTFCQANIVAQSPSFNNNNARQSPETFCHKQQRDKESLFFSDIETKASTPKNVEKEAPIDIKERTNIKIVSILEDSRNRKPQALTPKNITSLGTLHDGDNFHSKSVSHAGYEREDRLITDVSRIGSETKDLQFFVNALEEFKEENKELINQLELPASIPELPENGSAVSGVKSTLSIKGEDQNHAEPVSLGTLENESAILLNTEEIDSTLMDSQIKFWKGSSIRKSYDSIQQKDSPRMNTSPKDMKEIKLGKKELVNSNNGRPGLNSPQAIKPEVQPRMVEITLTLDSKNKPKIDQKPENSLSQELLLQRLPSPKLRANNSLSSTPTTEVMATIQGALSLNGSRSNKKKTVTPKASMFKDSKAFLSPNSKGNRFFSKTPQGSPKIISLDSPSASSVKSPTSSVFHKVETKSLTTSPVKNTKSKMPEKPVERTRTPQRTAKSYQELGKPGIRASPIKPLEHKKMGKGSNQQLHDYLNEETISLPVTGVKQNGQKIDIIEQNLKKINGKNLLIPTSQKHIRYPSFGGNVQDKEGKLSTRRTTSQEPHSDSNLQKSIKSKEKLDTSKELNISKEEHNNSQLSINHAKANTIHIINMKDFEISDPKRKTPEMPKLVITKPADSPTGKKPVIQQEKPETKKYLLAGNHQLIVDTSSESNFLDSPAPLSIYSGSSISSQHPKLVDIYERNSRWINIKEDRLHVMAATKKKEEMKECTFKPSRNTTLNVESVYSQKSYNNFGVVRILTETSNSAEKRSISKEKKALNSYKGLHTLKKEIISPKRGSIDGPKSNFFNGKEGHKGIDLYSK